jgi:hypothetical protein
MYRITSRMSSMALTLSGKAKRAGKGPYLPRSTASVNSVRLNFCMVAELSDATVRDGRSTPSHWPTR